MKKILVIAPHPDDEVLGCGGAIQYHVNRGDSVFVHIVADRVKAHTPDEAYVRETVEQARESARILGAREVFFSHLRDEQLDVRLIDVIVPIESILATVKADVVYVPHEGDTDQDHRAVANACKVACRYISKVLAYEVLGPTRNFSPNHFIDIEGYLSTKIEALHAYAGELYPFPHPRSDEALFALAKVRGVQAGFLAAEAFVLLREVVQ
jgi:N-acetylglucosamine malate deacetylase 1